MPGYRDQMDVLFFDKDVLVEDLMQLDQKQKKSVKPDGIFPISLRKRKKKVSSEIDDISGKLKKVDDSLKIEQISKPVLLRPTDEDKVKRLQEEKIELNRRKTRAALTLQYFLLQGLHKTLQSRKTDEKSFHQFIISNLNLSDPIHRALMIRLLSMKKWAGVLDEVLTRSFSNDAAVEGKTDEEKIKIASIGKLAKLFSVEDGRFKYLEPEYLYVLPIETVERVREKQPKAFSALVETMFKKQQKRYEEEGKRKEEAKSKKEESLLKLSHRNKRNKILNNGVTRVAEFTLKQNTFSSPYAVALKDIDDGIRKISRWNCLFSVPPRSRKTIYLERMRKAFRNLNSDVLDDMSSEELNLLQSYPQYASFLSKSNQTVRDRFLLLKDTRMREDLLKEEEEENEKLKAEYDGLNKETKTVEVEKAISLVEKKPEDGIRILINSMPNRSITNPRLRSKEAVYFHRLREELLQFNGAHLKELTLVELQYLADEISVFHGLLIKGNSSKKKKLEAALSLLIENKEAKEKLSMLAKENKSLPDEIAGLKVKRDTVKVELAEEKQQERKRLEIEEKAKAEAERKRLEIEREQKAERARRDREEQLKREEEEDKTRRGEATDTLEEQRRQLFKKNTQKSRKIILNYCVENNQQSKKVLEFLLSDKVIGAPGIDTFKLRLTHDDDRFEALSDKEEILSKYQHIQASLFQIKMVLEYYKNGGDQSENCNQLIGSSVKQLQDLCVVPDTLLQPFSEFYYDFDKADVFKSLFSALEKIARYDFFAILVKKASDESFLQAFALLADYENWLPLLSNRTSEKLRFSIPTKPAKTFSEKLQARWTILASAASKQPQQVATSQSPASSSSGIVSSLKQGGGRKLTATGETPSRALVVSSHKTNELQAGVEFSFPIGLGTFGKSEDLFSKQFSNSGALTLRKPKIRELGNDENVEKLAEIEPASCEFIFAKAVMDFFVLCGEHGEEEAFWNEILDDKTTGTKKFKIGKTGSGKVITISYETRKEAISKFCVDDKRLSFSAQSWYQGVQKALYKLNLATTFYSMGIHEEYDNCDGYFNLVKNALSSLKTSFGVQEVDIEEAVSFSNDFLDSVSKATMAFKNIDRLDGIFSSGFKNNSANAGDLRTLCSLLDWIQFTYYPVSAKDVQQSSFKEEGLAPKEAPTDVQEDFLRKVNEEKTVPIDFGDGDEKDPNDSFLQEVDEEAGKIDFGDGDEKGPNDSFLQDGEGASPVDFGEEDVADSDGGVLKGDGCNKNKQEKLSFK